MKPFYKICCILGLLAVAIFANSCNNETAEADSERIKILGIDKDGNGVRDDLDSLIDANIPDSPEKRAAYRYLAQAIQNQWTAFYENPQMTYEELLPYEIYASLGATLYNTMELILDCGLVIRHQFGHNCAQDEKSYKFRQHDHFIDTETEQVMEFCDPRLWEIQRAIVEQLGVEITHHSLIFYGHKKNVE